MAYPMGEAKLEPLRVDFDRRVKLEFHGSDISSDGGFFPTGPAHNGNCGANALGATIVGNRREPSGQSRFKFK